MPTSGGASGAQAGAALAPAGTGPTAACGALPGSSVKPEPQTDVGHWKRVSDSETNFSLGAGHKPKSHNLKR
jgi:hypothetical protein